MIRINYMGRGGGGPQKTQNLLHNKSLQSAHFRVTAMGINIQTNRHTDIATCLGVDSAKSINYLLNVMHCNGAKRILFPEGNFFQN